MENGALPDERRDCARRCWSRIRSASARSCVHPVPQAKPTTVGLLWHLQAQLLARHLRGDLDGYPPFVWRLAL